jgi:hypothetical protein
MGENWREDLLYEFFADECAFAGADNVAAILAGNYRPIQVELGERMPIAEIVAFVVGAVGFIDAALSLFDRWRMNTLENTATDFVRLARSELKIPEDVDDETVVKLLERVASKK